MVLERGTRERLYNAFPTVLSLSLSLSLVLQSVRLAL